MLSSRYPKQKGRGALIDLMSYGAMSSKHDRGNPYCRKQMGSYIIVPSKRDTSTARHTTVEESNSALAP